MSKQSGGIPKGGGGGPAKGSGGNIPKGGGGGSTSRIQSTPRPARPMDPGKARASQARQEAQRERQAEWDRQGAALNPIGGLPGPGGSLGYADPGALSWTQQAQRLQQQFANLQDDIMLTSVHREMGRVEGQLASLSSRLAELRRHGYLFASFLEPQIEALTDQWEGLRDQVDDDVEMQSSQLAQQAGQVRGGMQQLLNGQAQLLPQVDAAVQALSRQAGAAREAILGRTAGVAQGIGQLNQHIEGAEFLLNAVAQASFPLLEGEYIVAATPARLLDDEGKGPQGLLYLTDDRLLFEQKEQEATRKFLFVVLESQQVQELLFSTLLGWITKVEIQDKGGLLGGSQELLTLTLSSEAPRSLVTFQLLGSSNEAWAGIIQRARSGDLERERVDGVAAEKAAAQARSAAIPTLCPSCGARLPTEIVRGQRTLTCSYCGYELRLTDAPAAP